MKKNKQNMRKVIKLLFRLLIILIIITIISVIGVIKLNENLDKNKNEMEENNEQNIENNDIIEINKEEKKEEIEEFVEEKDDGTKVNISSKFNETKTFNGLEFSNMKMISSGGLTQITADVKNNTGKDMDITVFDVILLDKEGKTIVNLGGIINKTKKGESTKLTCTTTLDFANAYDYKIEIK